MIGKPTISNVGKMLKQGLAQELRDQGHYLTGALEDSIADRANENADGASLDVEALDYIQRLDEGVEPSEIGDFSEHVAKMTEYAQKRMGARGRLAARIGFRIAKKHAEEGIPTKASYRFSNTGERLHVIQETYDRIEDQIDQQLEQGLDRELDDLIDKTFDQTVF